MGSDIALADSERAEQRRQRWHASLLLSPAIFWLTCFFLAPLLIVLLYSFAERGPYGSIEWRFTLGNYARFADKLYLCIFLESLWLALLTTVICLLLGYPFAYALTRVNRRWRSFLLVLVVIPFWSNFLVRTYAWIVLLRAEGVINSALMWLGFTDEPLTLLYTRFAVLVGLVYGHLPFMILPLYASLEKIDHRLVEAARDLGASDRWAFLKITLPLSMPGVVAGSILVFVPALGAFVTPDLLGGGKIDMIGNLVQRQFLTARDWPFGSAISFVLMAIVLVAVLGYQRVSEARWK
jgi:spermidine/putrescine transport system permease protein